MELCLTFLKMPKAIWISYRNNLMGLEHPNPPDVLWKKKKKTQSMFNTHTRMSEHFTAISTASVVGLCFSTAM